MKRVQNKFCIVYLCCIFTTDIAFSNDTGQKIYIQADNATYNYKTGTDIYRGHVKIIQNTTELLGDMVMIYHSQDRSIEKMIAAGKPAHYITIPQGKQKQVYAEADRIEFYPDKKQIIFIEKAKITDDKNILTGPCLVYQTDTQTILTIPSKATHSSIVIEPNNE